MEEEYILKSNWDNILTRDMLNMDISAYDYTQLISLLKPFNDQQKPAKTQDIPDSIIEEYFE